MRSPGEEEGLAGWKRKVTLSLMVEDGGRCLATKVQLQRYNWQGTTAKVQLLSYPRALHIRTYQNPTFLGQYINVLHIRLPSLGVHMTQMLQILQVFQLVGLSWTYEISVTKFFFTTF